MNFRDIKTYIFDMDGVIIDSEPLHKKIECEIFEDLEVEVSKEEHSGFVGMSSIDMWSSIVNNNNLDITPQEIAKIQSKKYLKLLKYNKTVTLIQGVKEVINKIYNLHKNLVLASSSTRQEIEMVLEISGLKKYFPIIISGAELPKSKPDPLIFIKASEISKTLPEDCCVIEDSENGVIAAKEAGMQCIGFNNPNSGKQNLFSADVILDDFLSLNKLITK